MAGVIFYFEENDIDVFSGRELDISAWNYAIKTAGDITKVIIINKTNQVISSFDSDLVQFTVISSEDDLNIPSEDVVVQIACPWNQTQNERVSLWNFDHNVDWYYFGPANGWINLEDSDKVVYVPQNGQGAMHAIHIVSAVMLHRYKVKSNL